MKWSHSLPLTLVAVVAIAGAALIATAMFVTDQGEEALHLYNQVSGTKKVSAGSSSDPMELQGRWMGMSLAATDSASARAIGGREGESGVVVVDLARQGGERATAAGLTLGDRITSVDGKPIRNMADLYNVSRTVDAAAPTLVEVRRGDFPMTLVMPAMAAAGNPGPGLEAAFAPGQYYCPREGLLLPAGNVGPGLRCPRCQTPLQPYGRPWR